ncbi:MAG TPA: hypothetical protein VFS20_12090 [Longimicrobium sp.]|nr:hypothetical protein [Longimicrobium sp.]
MFEIILGLIFGFAMIGYGLQMILVPKEPRWIWILYGIVGAISIVGALILMWRLVTAES